MNLLFFINFFLSFGLIAHYRQIESKRKSLPSLCRDGMHITYTHAHAALSAFGTGWFDSIAIPWSTVIYGEAHYVETCTYPVCLFYLVPFPFHYWRRRPTSPSHYYRETFLIDRNGIEADVIFFNFYLEQNQRRPRSPPARRPPGLPSLPSARSRLVEEV